MEKLVAIGNHPVHQTCVEDDQLVLEVLLSTCLLCACQRLTEE